MELELGLAPASHRFLDMTGDSDLNGGDKSVPEKNQAETAMMRKKKKRSFDEAASESSGRPEKRTLALFRWGGKGDDGEEDDGNDAEKLRNCLVHQRRFEEESTIVGWPPIRSWRKRALHEQQGHQWGEDGGCGHWEKS
ncbi:unnamed protein product [Cuscuta campestris]|uniref:Auxin-responsive protein n=1 Tax=Cuscuta campestris TaxID=132261 RepID=A0A484M7E4_9ASTE|nr:unnamed protein product [Cuscuta campestris]